MSQETERQNHTQQKMLETILGLLTKSKPGLPPELPPEMIENAEFIEICRQIQDLRQLSVKLSRGDLTGVAESRGFLISNMKAIQAHLRHIAWQAGRIAQGDYSQTLDFLGEISDSFNEMNQKLATVTKQLVEQANMDALTGVSNRLALDNFLTDAFNHARQQGKSMSIMVIDIDHFKKINDTYGHLVGDEVLKAVAKRLQKQIRLGDCLARYGGEEFVAVLMGTEVAAAKAACKRMLETISGNPIRVEGQKPIPLTISAGVSEMHPGDLSYEEVVKRSDIAVYAAKEAGRNRFWAYEELE